MIFEAVETRFLWWSTRVIFWVVKKMGGPKPVFLGGRKGDFLGGRKHDFGQVPTFAPAAPLFFFFGWRGKKCT